MRRSTLLAVRVPTLFALLVIAALAPSASPAAVLFSQAPSVLTNGYVSDSSGGAVRYFDDFTLAAPATVQRVTWRGVYAMDSTPAFPLLFRLGLYATSATAGNVPDLINPLSTTSVQFTDASQITDTGLLVIGEKVWEFSADVTPVTLAAGTRYWFSPYANTINDTDTFYWNTSDVDGSSAREAGESSSATAATSGDHYFILEGTIVPEPASSAVLGVGSLALLWRRRRH